MIQQLLIACPRALLSLFHGIIKIGYHPEKWREALIRAIPKAGKPSYLVAKAYRPISLLSCLSKVLERIMASRLTFMLESNHCLPNEHHGFRPKRSTIDAFEALLSDVREAWAAKKKVSALFVDFKGAFDRVPHVSILTKLRSLNVPEYMTDWVEAFLHNRSARIRVDGFMGDKFWIPIGVPQGSPISPILFIVFNSDVIRVIKEAQILHAGMLTAKHAHGCPAGFADDISIWITGTSLEENAVRLASVAAAVSEWAQQTGQVLESSKTILIHFSREHRKMSDQPWVQLDGSHIHPSKAERFLGLIVDSRLNWSAHVRARTTLALKVALGTRLVYRQSHALPMNRLREIFIGKLWSILTYGIETWGGDLAQTQLDSLISYYRQELIKLSGAMRSTPLKLLGIELRIASLTDYIEVQKDIRALPRSEATLFAP